VGQSIIVSNADPCLLRKSLADPGKEIMVLLFPCAQQDEADVETEEVFDHLG